jgi:hypothetical protein
MLFSVHKIFDERNKKIRNFGSVQCLVAICEINNFWKNFNQLRKESATAAVIFT